MARRDPETHPAGYLGDELRRARLAAGFASQDALAARLGFDRTVITKIESGDGPPAVDVLAAWCQACGLPGIPPDWVAGMAKRSNGATPPWFGRWLDAEGEAQSFRLWSPMLIPGLLQTAEYARALFLASQTDTSDEVIDALVTARTERQAILDRADPPDVAAVVDEAVLHRLIGSSQIMHDALVHVADLSRRPNVVVQVVPAGSGANAGLGGAFYIADADGMPGTLLMINVEDQTTETRSLVRKAAVAFDRVRGNALTRDASRDLILRLADELWKA
jgi:transcriptional regulator with XRE-family HTH domain